MHKIILRIRRVVQSKPYVHTCVPFAHTPRLDPPASAREEGVSLQGGVYWT